MEEGGEGGLQARWGKHQDLVPLYLSLVFEFGEGRELESVIEGYKAVIRDSIAYCDAMTVSSPRMRDCVSESTSWQRPLILRFNALL